MDYLEELIDDRRAKDPEFAQIWAAVELVDELASRREAMGLSQQQIADQMGVARARVSEIENHPERVSFARILAYANSVGAHFTVNGPKVSVTRPTAPKGRPVIAVRAKHKGKGQAA